MHGDAQRPGNNGMSDKGPPTAQDRPEPLLTLTVPDVRGRLKSHVRSLSVQVVPAVATQADLADFIVRADQ